jgi:hypothetical protein
MRVALITCRVLPEPDTDQEPLVLALRAAGLRAELVAWDDPGADPRAHELCVLRSCWNYHLDPAAFEAWLARAERATRVLNPPAVVRWNLHKRYLAELEARGLPVVACEHLERGSRAIFAGVLDERGWSDVVVKPAVSASSYRTRRFARGEEAAGQAFLDDLIAERDAMIQPYLRSVERSGERSLVWIGGRFTHAIAKAPRFEGGEERVSGALALRPAELALGDAVIGALGELARELLYARLDLIEDDDGVARISELELIEPSLFLVQSPPALRALVDAIGGAARASR